MAIINDREQKGLEGLSAPADISAADDLSRINLNALFFMASVPPKYQALIAPALAIQADKVKLEQKRKHDHQIELETGYQEAAERHILKFTIDGEDIEISQADLSKSMKSRVQTLEEQRQALERNGKNPEEVKRLGELIDQYKPVITDIDAGKDDPGTMHAVQGLIKQDPEWAAKLKRDSAANLAMLKTTDKKTSFSAQAFDDGTIVAPPLKAAFTKGVSPDVQLPPETQKPALNKTQQAAANMAQTLGI